MLPLTFGVGRCHCGIVTNRADILNGRLMRRVAQYIQPEMQKVGRVGKLGRYRESETVVMEWVWTGVAFFLVAVFFLSLFGFLWWVVRLLGEGIAWIVEKAFYSEDEDE